MDVEPSRLPASAVAAEPAVRQLYAFAAVAFVSSVPLSVMWLIPVYKSGGAGLMVSQLGRSLLGDIPDAAAVLLFVHWLRQRRGIIDFRPVAVWLVLYAALCIGFVQLMTLLMRAAEMAPYRWAYAADDHFERALRCGLVMIMYLLMDIALARLLPLALVMMLGRASMLTAAPGTLRPLAGVHLAAALALGQLAISVELLMQASLLLPTLMRSPSMAIADTMGYLGLMPALATFLSLRSVYRDPLPVLSVRRTLACSACLSVAVLLLSVPAIIAVGVMVVYSYLVGVGVTEVDLLLAFGVVSVLIMLPMSWTARWCAGRFFPRSATDPVVLAKQSA